MSAKLGQLIRLLPKVRKKRRITELTYFVTEKCNMACGHCFNRLKNTEKIQEELSVEEVDKFSGTLGPMLRVVLSGGEPFLRKDLSEICAALIRNTDLVHLSIPTNGSVPGKIVRDVQKIASSFPGTFVEIKISLDQLDEKRDEFTSHPGGFSMMVETARRLKQQQKTFRNIGLSVITTCVPENRKELKRIYEFGRDVLKVEHHSMSLARDMKGYHPELDPERSFDFYNTVLDNKKNAGLNMPFYGIMQKLTLYRMYLDVRYRQGRSDYVPCFSGRIRAVLDPYGNLYPCEIKGYPYSSSGQDSWIIGNIRDFGYDAVRIWKSERAEKIRTRIKETECVCNHGCDMNTNILFNWRILLKALTMPAGEMRRMIKEKGGLDGSC